MDLDLVPILADAIKGYYEDSEILELCDLYDINLDYEDNKPSYLRLSCDLIVGIGEPSKKSFLKTLVQSLLTRAREGAGKSKWDRQEYHRSMVDNITAMKTELERVTSELSDNSRQHITPDPITYSEDKHMPDPKQVFVVHGRDDNLRRDFFAFLRALDLKPLEWSEALKLTKKASPYIGEVLDKAFDNAQAIVVLLTPDDEVRLISELWSSDEDESEKEFRLQPRPNVLFEAGMAFGRNPNRTLLIEVGRVKAFSDIAGRHVIRLTDSPENRQDVAERLQTAGCAVSTSGRDWMKQGKFSISRGKVPPVSESYQHELSVKWVDLQYPNDVGLISELENQGYRARWCQEDKLARRLDIEGWLLVTHTADSGKKVVLKVKDRPQNQTLIMKKDS